MPVDLRVKLGPLELRNPVICSAGEHTSTLAGLNAAIDAGAGAVVAKSANESDAGRRQAAATVVTYIDAQRREVAPDIHASIFNRSGLVTEPWDRWLEILKRADAHAQAVGAYVAVSVIPAAEDVLPTLARDVQAAGLRWFELNLSAPHAGEASPGVIERPNQAGRVSRLVTLARGELTIPLSVKLTAESADLISLARAAREAGADAVSMTGRHMGFMPDVRTRRPLLSSFGAISGPWSLPLALRWVAKVRGALGPELPLIGSNGARDGEDVARFMLAGASAVQIATAVIVEGPSAITRILHELEGYLDSQGVDAATLIGEAADATLSYQQLAAAAQQ